VGGRHRSRRYNGSRRSAGGTSFNLSTVHGREARSSIIRPKNTLDATQEPSPFRGISRNVYLLSLVSLFTDFSSEMIYPLVPLFLSTVLGAPVAVIGVIEGIAETTASLLKWITGGLSDRLGKRKPFVLAGYGLAAVSKPLLALAFAWPVVLGARVMDRFGKGVRGSARDALLADSTTPEVRGRAYGFHRSGDSIGAVLGPLAAVFILAYLHDSFRTAFLIAFIPGVLSTLLILAVREPAAERKPGPLFQWKQSGTSSRPLRWFLLATFVFGIGNSSDMFLILRANQLGAGNVTAVLMFACCNVLSVLSSFPAGIVSDRLGRKRVLISGFLLFAGVYLGFGMAGNLRILWVLFAVYGVYQGLTDGITKALIVDLVPQSERGAALGLQATVLGMCTLPASLIAGFLWQYRGPAAAFLYGSGTALTATAILAIFLVGKAKKSVTPV
jgi:MFS family permease